MTHRPSPKRGNRGSDDRSNPESAKRAQHPLGCKCDTCQRGTTTSVYSPSGKRDYSPRGAGCGWGWILILVILISAAAVVASNVHVRGFISETVQSINFSGQPNEIVVVLVTPTAPAETPTVEPTAEPTPTPTATFTPTAAPTSAPRRQGRPQ